MGVVDPELPYGRENRKGGVQRSSSVHTVVINVKAEGLDQERRYQSIRYSLGNKKNNRERQCTSSCPVVMNGAIRRGVR